MIEDAVLVSTGTAGTALETKGENQLSEETKMNANIPSIYMGDQNDYSESMLLGQFPDNFDVSDACGWMTHDDYSDFQQQKRFEGNDSQQLFTADNSYNLNFAPEVIDQQPLHENQLGLGQGMSQNSTQVASQNNQQLIAQTNIVNQQSLPLLQAPLAQPQKVQEIMLSSSQYSQQLHEMHLHHLEQISHTTNSSEYYNRPLEGPRSVLPIDSMNHETGESHKDGNDSGDSSGDDSDFADMEDGEEGDEGKRRKNASQQSAKAKNREHAKNTRIRKKHYIEALKESLKLLFDEREKIDKDRRNSLSRLAEQANVRKQVLQTMFYYRASAETSIKRWGSILDDNFTLVLPITPYRSFPPAEVIAGQRRVNGVEAMIVDTTSLSVMVQSIGVPHKDGDKVRVQYYSGPEDTIMTGDSFMCKWLLRTENAVSRGARYEVFKQGMIKAIFTPQNRMVYLELSFDVMSFMQQLRRASGKQDFQVVPNTVAIAREEACEARVITEATHPYRITYASQSWCDLFGYEASKVIGQTCKILQGEETEMDRIEEIMNGVKFGRAGSTVLTNYNSDGEKMTISLKTYPLYTEIALTHYLGVVEPVYSKFTDNGSVSTSGHTTEGSTSSSLASPRPTHFQNNNNSSNGNSNNANNQDQTFIHSLTLPQSTGWIKKESSENNAQNTSHRNQNATGGRTQTQNPLKEKSHPASDGNRTTTDNSSFQPTYTYNSAAQNTSQGNNTNNNNNSSGNVNVNANNCSNSNSQSQGRPTNTSSRNNNNNNSSNNSGGSSAHPLPGNHHQHHTHHQHQVPPPETELSRFPPYDATYKSTSRQASGSVNTAFTQPSNTSVPHQAVTQQHLSQQQQLQQQQQQQQPTHLKIPPNTPLQDEFVSFSNDLGPYCPSSPNPAPLKSSKPNAPYNSQSASSVPNVNANDNCLQNSSSQNIMYNQYSNSCSGDVEEVESESCPATRVPKWCQDIRASTPLSADDASGVSSSNYSDDQTHFENEDK